MASSGDRTGREVVNGDAAAVPDAVGDTARDVRRAPEAGSQAAALPARAVLLPLLLAQFINSYDTQSMNVAIQNIVTDLDTTVTGVQSALALYTLVMAAGMITGSKLAGIWGLRRTFRAGVIAYGIGALITALSTGLGMMVLGWSLLEGLGSVLMIPPIYILATVTFKDPPARAAAFGAIAAAAGAGGAMGPLLGGIITTAVSWRLSFALEVVAVVIILLLSRRIIDPGVQEPRPKLDVIGAVLSAAGMTSVVLGALLAGTYGFFVARQPFAIAGLTLIPEGGISPTLILFAIGIGLLIGFGAWVWHLERRGEEPLVHRHVLRNRVSVPGLIAQNAQWFLSSGITFVTAVFLQLVFDFSAIETGLMMLPVIIGLVFFSRRSAQVSRKYPPRRIMLAGFLLVEAGVAALLLMVDPTGPPWRFIPGLFLIGSGLGLVGPASVNVVQSAFGDEDQAEISGVSRSVSNLGSSLGVAVAGAVLVSALVTIGSQLTAENTTLPPDVKSEVNAALEGSVSAVSDEQVEAALQGQPETVVLEVVRINAQARDRALGLALFVLGAVGLFGVLASLFLPGRPSQRAERA